MFKFNKNRKKGFSLVELIVVIAILAVIAIVLIPALLSYVEESRAGKDTKTTDELVSSVELALSEQDVYDELLEHAIEDNVSCYVDKLNESECTNKIVIKAATDSISEWYEFGDDDRKADETPYFAGGNMRGVTITFSPVKSSNESEYILKDGVINKFVGRNTGYVHENGKIYNAIRSVMGDVMNNSSQTYRNSDFTIFIRMGTTGGNEASQQDAVKVYGQFNGTNLTANDTNLYKLTADRQTGADGLVDFALNEKNNASKGQPDFSESAFMGSGVTTSTGTGNVVQKAPENLTNTAIAFYCEDDASLNFTRIDESVSVGDVINGKTATAIYYNIETDIYPNGGSVPWATYREQIKSVKTLDWVQPIYTQYWFATFKNCNNFDLSKMDTSKTVSMMGMFGFAGYNCKEFTLNLSGFSADNLKTTKNMFYDTGYNSEKVYINLFETSSVTDMTNMFREAGYNSKSFKIKNLDQWDVSNVTTLQSLFYQAGYNATTYSIGDFSNWNTQNVTHMGWTFFYSGYSADNWQVGDLSNWKTSKVTNMKSMFCYAGQNSNTWNIGNISSWNVSNVLDMSYMFNESGVQTIDVSGWNAQKVTNLYGMFLKCYKLKNANISNFNAQNASTMRAMFQYCENLEEINVKGLNMSNVKDIGWMFSNCLKLKSIDVTGWDVSNIEMFGCVFQVTGGGNRTSSLRTIKGLETWDTSNGKYFDEMFYRCSVEELNLSSFDTRNATNSYIPENINTNGHPLEAINNMIRSTKYLKKVILGPNFSLNGDGSCSPMTLDAPDSEYVNGADGKWYSVKTGEAYTYTDETTKIVCIPNNNDTYVAINPN